MHCHADRRLIHAIGPLRPARSVFVQRLRMSSFLNRWLEYLAEQGHSVGTLEALRVDSSDAAAQIENPEDDAAARIVRRIAG
jgi:hypothetical protein